ncbi:glycosyltransferase family 4 protein [Virgibacillus sp. C22-A2]|uniref:Glycosyltransferase family 4 protein n=1 Tax=Virgibacillus tibetensis TaxID=3042313 RepID=A0ABU6KDP3_9BACI|nr:glycosyltransferase family 4 protein [Virgibacillus sp. C22-A2]
MIKEKVYNIVILNHHANTPDSTGGGRHYDLTKKLSELGHNVTVLASSYDNKKREYRFDEDVKETRYNENFKFVSIKTKPAYTNSVGRFLNYVNYKKKASSYDNYNVNPDVIIASSVHPLAWDAGYKLSRKYNAKFIVEVRDLWPLSMYEDFTGIKKKVVFSYFESLEKKFYNLADAIITTAPYAYEYMEQKYGTDRKKVFHIPHGLDIEEFDKLAGTSEDNLPSELNEVLNDCFCVTYTGALSKSEGLSTFVESAKFLKDHEDIKLVVVGGGPEKTRLNKIIKENKLDNVLMVDSQSKNHIPLILKKSNLLICGLMEREAFKYGISKNKFYEYMAAEKPIIFASNVRGSLITKANAGITIEPDKPEKLKETILHIYNNIDTLGREFAKNGRAYVEEHHTVQIITESFLEVISNSKKQ